MNIGANIKKFRKEKGFTQQQLADSISKSKSIIQKYEANEVGVNFRVSIGNYERGDREPKIGTLQIISEALGVTIEELITGKKQDVKVVEKDITQFSTEELLEELYRRTL